MATNAEIKALIETRVRAQRSHILHDGVAEILDFMVDNISAGPGGVSGIDDVLAEAQALTVERIIDLNGKSFGLLNGDLNLLRIDIDEGGSSGYLRSKSANGLNRGEVNPASTDERTITQIWASFNNDERLGNIEIDASATEAFIKHTANRYQFAIPGGTDVFVMDADGAVLNVTDGDAVARITMVGTTDAAAIRLRADNDTNNLSIDIEAADNIITHNAGTHTFNTGDIVITALAGGGTTGLSIDTNGKIIRTP